MSRLPPNHPQPPEPPFGSGDPAELAELYAAGALSPADAADFERRVAAGEAAYVAAYQAVLPALDALLSAEPVAPSEHTRKSLESRLLAEAVESTGLFTAQHKHDHDEEPTPQSTRTIRHAAGRAAAGEHLTDPAIVIARAVSGRWRRTGVRGVRYQPLYADTKANRRTILLDMAPGTALPDHDHAGDEEIIMISGDLTIAGTVLGPGDYIRIPAGARHGVPRTIGGCICIVVMAYMPFPLSSWPGMVWSAFKGLFKSPGARGRSRHGP